MKSPEKETTDQQNRNNRLYTEKIKVIYRQIPSGIFSTFLCASIYSFAVWDFLPHPGIIVWLLLHLFILGGRYGLYLFYKKSGAERKDGRWWGKSYTYLTYLSGLAWGSASIFLFPENSLPHHLFLTLLISGIISGTVTLYSVLSEISIGFTLFSSLPIIVRLFSYPDAIHIGTAIASSLFAVTMVVTSKHLQKSMARGFELNEDLKQEVDEHRLTEKALQEEREKLEMRVQQRTIELSQVNNQLRKLTNAIEQANEMVVITDLEGTIDYVNPMVEKTTGYHENELLGKPFQDFYRYKKEGTPLDDIFKIIGDGKDWQGEMVNQKKSGASYVSEMTMNAVYDDQNKITHYVAIMRDVSDKKRLEQDLFQANKLSSLGTLTSGIAHELNTPLATILGFSEEIERSQDIPPQINLHAQWITQESKRCVNIVRNLLKFSRKYKPRINIFNVNDSILSVLTLFKYQLKSDLIEVKTLLHEGPLFISGDPDHIPQVILNILLNAREAIESTETRGTVKISSHQTENIVSILIENNGPPIPKENLEKIFDPFFTDSKVGEGTGLGLSVSYGIIKEHQGQIHVKNIEPEGVQFLITLPLSDHQPVENDIEDCDFSSLKGLRVLIVEDDDKFREWLRMFLYQKEAIITVASNGIEAIDQIKKSKADIILSDIKMPIMGGVDLCRWIEKNQPEMLKKLILLSGVIDSEIDDYCTEKEIPFLVKPVRKGELLMTLKRISRTGVEK